MDIHRSFIKDFIMPKVKSIIVIDYYEGIQGMLKSRVEFPYNDFLANPRLRTQTDIIWATDSFTERPKLLSELNGVLKERYSFALKERINSIESLIEILKQEEGGVSLSELLSKAISYIDERSVYCGDGNIVVVNWGLIPRTPDLGFGTIYRSGKFVANWGKLQNTFDIINPNIEQTPNSQTIHSDLAKSVTNNEPQLQSEEIDVADQQSSDEPTTVETGKEDNTIQIAQSLKSEEVKPVEQSNPTIKEKDKTQQEESPKEDKKKEEKNDDEYTWRTFLEGFGKGMRFILQKLWRLVLLILLICAILFLCKGCQGPISQINPFFNPLPDNPIVLPIEKEEVGMSADGMTQIATDRLNILLEKKGDNTMLEWAKAFKKVYPKNGYEIFYYNTELYHLQIKVPSEEREQVKKEINNKLKSFSFDVFEEPVSCSDFISFNDSELNDSTLAWYLHAIGAFDAWNQVQGDSNIVVAVVDNGFDLTHPEFEGKVVHPFNVITKNSTIRPIITINGKDAHGTHVAATAIGNSNNGRGLLGIAPNCKFLPVQVGNDNLTGSMSNLAIMEGVMYAINQGADVINVSLGMHTPNIVREMSEAQQLNYINNTNKHIELMWSKIFEKANQKNCVIVFAAGNDNIVSGVDPKKRCNETILVSALNTELTKAQFSNYGVYPQLNKTYSTVSAPGVSIYSAAPHNTFITMDGTSMAAPIVSGSVALIKSIDKSLSVKQIINIIQNSGLGVSEKIGPMLQLQKAINMVRDKKQTEKPEDIRKEIHRLQDLIDSLKRMCPEEEVSPDTLKYDNAIKDKHGLDGLWKSTTTLVATKDNSPIELYMKFKKQKGTLIIMNKGIRYEAPLKAMIKGGRISIVQKTPATNGDVSFIPYTYKCTSDRKGNLTCTATSSENSLTFNLVREKNINN